MARNGSGTFTRLYDFTADRDSGSPLNVISADRIDGEFDDISTALTASIAKDGQTTPTADLPMGGFKHTSVATTISARAQYTPVAVFQDGGPVFVAAAGTDTITATYSPVVPALVNGAELRFRAAAANATTTPTFSPNGLTAKTIVKGANTALVAGDIAGQHHECVVRYNSTTDKWHLLNPVYPAGYTVENMNSLTTDATGGAVGDFIPFVDISESNATNKVTTQSLINNVMTGFTADTSPDVADSLLTYDASATSAKTTTITNFYKTINALTADGAPDATTDYVATYDASATGGKKVLLQNLVSPTLSAKTGNYTVVDADRSSSIRFAGLSADATLTLPAASGRAGFVLYVSNEDTNDTTGYGVIIDPNASELIDGFSSRKGWVGTRVTLFCDGTGWRTVSGYYRYFSGDQTITLAGSLTLAHGLGERPRRVWVEYKNATTEGGYAVNDIVSSNLIFDNASGIGGAGVWTDATNVNIRFAANFALRTANKTTGADVAGTAANWRARFYAEV